MNLIDDYIPNRFFYIGGVTGTLIVSILQAIASSQDIVNDFLGLFTARKAGLDGLQNALSRLPLAGIGIGWLLPALIFALVFGLYGRKKSMAAKKQ